MDREVEKWKLKSDGLVRQMERMDKAFQERANTLQVKLSAQGTLIRALLKQKQELEEGLADYKEGTEGLKLCVGDLRNERDRLRKMLKGRCTEEEWEALKEGEEDDSKNSRDNSNCGGNAVQED